jgi:lipoprotein signal peptidase
MKPSVENVDVFGSKLVNDVPNAQVQSLGNPPQSFNGDFLFGAFNFADVISIEVCFLSQFFLAQFGLFSFSADSLA